VREAVPGKVQRTRQKLINAIREEVAETGSFSAELIARRAGISMATFYNHFTTKDDALISAYEQLMGDLVELVEDKCRIDTLLDAGLRQLIESWVAHSAIFFRHNASLFRLAQVAIERSKTMRNLFREHEMIVIKHYQRFIERGQAASLIRAGNAETMAEVLAVVSESWNHPLVQRLEEGSEFHQELTESVTRILEPANQYKQEGKNNV
jgi:AcrR family transcriptional regulator